MRIIVLGDTHGRAFWKLIKEKEKWDKIVFIGDYFDSHGHISGEVQIRNFQEIAHFKEENPDKVILLIGNHDHHYFPGIGDGGTSGYQYHSAPAIGHLLATYRDSMQMAYAYSHFLFSHAGIGEGWLENNTDYNSTLCYTTEQIADKVNDVWKYKPTRFCFTGRDFTGDDMGQTPIWIRPLSLTKDSHDLKKQGIIQIVGHTYQHKIHTDDVSTLKGSYYFIDTLGTSGEYLIINDGKIEVGKVC